MTNIFSSQERQKIDKLKRSSRKLYESLYKTEKFFYKQQSKANIIYDEKAYKDNKNNCIQYINDQKTTIQGFIKKSPRMIQSSYNQMRVSQEKFFQYDEEVTSQSIDRFNDVGFNEAEYYDCLDKQKDFFNVLRAHFDTPIQEDRERVKKAFMAIKLSLVSRQAMNNVLYAPSSSLRHRIVLSLNNFVKLYNQKIYNLHKYAVMCLMQKKYLPFVMNKNKAIICWEEKVMHSCEQLSMAAPTKPLSYMVLEYGFVTKTLKKLRVCYINSEEKLFLPYYQDRFLSVPVHKERLQYQIKFASIQQSMVAQAIICETYLQENTYNRSEMALFRRVFKDVMDTQLKTVLDDMLHENKSLQNPKHKTIRKNKMKYTSFSSLYERSKRTKTSLIAAH